jgi:hypothetical protein
MGSSGVDVRLWSHSIIIQVPCSYVGYAPMLGTSLSPETIWTLRTNLLAFESSKRESREVRRYLRTDRYDCYDWGSAMGFVALHNLRETSLGT